MYAFYEVLKRCSRSWNSVGECRNLSGRCAFLFPPLPCNKTWVCIYSTDMCLGLIWGTHIPQGGEGILDISEYCSSTVKNRLMHDTSLEWRHCIWHEGDMRYTLSMVYINKGCTTFICECIHIRSSRARCGGQKSSNRRPILKRLSTRIAHNPSQKPWTPVRTFMLDHLPKNQVAKLVRPVSKSLLYSKTGIVSFRYHYPTNSRGRIPYGEDRVVWNSQWGRGYYYGNWSW